MMLSSLVHSIHPQSRVSSTPKDVVTISTSPIPGHTMDAFLREVRGIFEKPLDPHTLYDMSAKLQEEFREKLRDSNICMLPSYHHTLPTGHERGTFLALDVGGSTFRIALVQLTGKDTWKNGMHIKRIRSNVISKQVRDLKGQAFFDWMADRIQEMLEEDGHEADSGDAPLLMGLAWSFPIEETSERGGSILAMGKGFMATHGVEGQDLCGLLMRSCRLKGLNVQLRTIVNDSSATLLSQAYRDASTCLSLILGTGTNAAIHLPVSALAHSKFGDRPQTWHDAATHVLVNSELSMSGGHVWSASRWDDELNRMHSLPGFQPLEYKVSGRYLGEIVRLILMEAIEQCSLFDGRIPERLDEPYALDTGTIAVFESDSSTNLAAACASFQQHHPLHSGPPALADLRFIKQVTTLVSSRAAAYLATAIHALWSTRLSSEGIKPDEAGHVTIACNGTVMERYPGFRERCQGMLDRLTGISGAHEKVTLEMARESSIFGAAVAVACMEETSDKVLDAPN